MPRLNLLVALFLGSLLLLAGCGGSGSTSQPSNPVASTNPTPNITSVTPASSSAQTLTITGTGFIASTVINFNSAALTTTYVSSTQVAAALSSSVIAADGTAKVTASNPSPGGGTSPALAYTITVPTPAVTALSPQSVPQGQPATITITGTGFEANSTAMWNGASRPTTFVNSTTIQVALTAADVQNFGTGQLSVSNPGTSPTTPLDLLIVANTPTITWVSPNSVIAYTGSNVPQQINFSGSGFAPNATVQANGVPVSVVSQTVTSVLISLPASFFAAPGSISIVVSNPGTPVVSSNTAVITVTGPAAASFTVSPNSAPAGSPDTTITLTGTGFYSDSVVSWNNTQLVTTYVSSSSVTAVMPAFLLSGFAQASISVSTPEDSVQPTPQPFDTFLELPVNDIVYNSTDGFIYASIPSSAGGGLGNSIAAIDPTTGVVQKTIFVGSEPNRLALSTDGTQLFIGLNGAGAVRQVNLTTGTAGVQFSLGGGPGLYNPPYTALSLAAVPGQPNSVAVYSSNGVVAIFDSGVARANASSGLQTYFDSNVGALAFGSSASTLYVMSNAIGGYLYQLTVGSSGITASTQLGTGTGGSTLQYDNDRLYIPTGVVFDATTGNQIGQFSATSTSSTAPTAAAGPIVSDSALNLAWIIPGVGAGQTQLVSFNDTTFDPVASTAVTGLGTIAPAANAADLIRWGQDGLAFHTASQLYVLQGPIVKDISNSPADLSIAVQAPATATTGSNLSYTVTVNNLGPNAAQGVTVTGVLPQSAIFGSVDASLGSCSGPGEFYCDLGTLASGSSATITVTVTPTSSGALETTASVSSVSYDPVSRRTTRVPPAPPSREAISAPCRL